METILPFVSKKGKRKYYTWTAKKSNSVKMPPKLKRKDKEETEGPTRIAIVNDDKSKVDDENAEKRRKNIIKSRELR